MWTQATWNVGKKHEEPRRAFAIKVPKDSTRRKGRKDFFISAHMKHASAAQLFRFPFELLLSFFRLYSRFSCRRKFLSKRTKRKEKRLQHYAITSREREERKLSEKRNKKRSWRRKSRETSVQFEEERSGTIRWINFCRDEMRRERDEWLSWQFKGCRLTSSNSKKLIVVCFRALFSEMLFLKASLALPLAKTPQIWVENEPTCEDSWKGMFVACLFLSSRALGSQNVFSPEKRSQLLFQNYVLRPLGTRLRGTEQSWGF